MRPSAVCGHCSQTLTEPQTAVRIPSTLVGRARAVTRKHGARPPTGESHQVRFLPTLGEPAVGEGMTKQVRVDVAEACTGRALHKAAADAALGHDAPQTEPE